MNVQFLSTVAVIAPDPPRSRRLHVDALGLPLQGKPKPGDYQHSEQISGCESFGIWPLSQLPRRASARRNGRPGDSCRRRASSSTLRTPRH